MAPQSPPEAGCQVGDNTCVAVVRRDEFAVNWVDDVDDGGKAADPPAGGEEAHLWQHDKVEFLRGGEKVPVPGKRELIRADIDTRRWIAHFSAEAEGATHAEVSAVREAPHVLPIRWRIDGDRSIEVVKLRTLKISTRVRLSVWCFYSPFVKSHFPPGSAKFTLDADLIAGKGGMGGPGTVKDANIDDISLISTIVWDQVTGGVKFFDFAPGGDTSRGIDPVTHEDIQKRVCFGYLRELISAMRKIDVQVQVGWGAADRNPKPPKSPASDADLKKFQGELQTANQVNGENKKFAEFLARAGNTRDVAAIDKLAKAAVDFFPSDVDIDGIGFDFEFAVAREQVDDVSKACGWLFQRTAHYMGVRKPSGFVTYANAAFDEDGQTAGGREVLNQFKVQPFSQAKGEKNLFARPQSFFDEGNLALGTFDNHKKSVDCALDPKKGGLHPSQVQFGVREANAEFEKMLRTLFRPHRVGVIVYRLPKPEQNPKAFFTRCHRYNEILNPSEALPKDRVVGQPLQVPKT